MKKILVILGGGRPKGNTRQLVNAFAQGAVDAGHDVEIISLNKVDLPLPFSPTKKVIALLKSSFLIPLKALILFK